MNKLDIKDMEWEQDKKGQFVWSATNGNKCYLLDYAIELEKEIERLKDIIELNKVCDGINLNAKPFGKPQQEQDKSCEPDLASKDGMEKAIEVMKKLEENSCEDCAGFGYVVNKNDGGDDECPVCKGTGKQPPEES